MAARQTDLRLYLDVIPDPSKVRTACIEMKCTDLFLQPEIPPQSIMVFLKHFDTTKQTLYGIGKAYMNRINKVSDLIPLINGRMMWDPATPLKLFEVRNNQM